MAEAAILERHEPVAVGNELNSKATKEIEQLLEQSELAREKTKTSNGGWYFRMPTAGVRYYSF